MVPQFDQVLFLDFDEAPPAGSLLGPVETEFGFHVTLVTDRNQNKDQVTELLARNDAQSLN
jgi:parvulin-like peptidyl-prolyl isomerase